MIYLPRIELIFDDGLHWIFVSDTFLSNVNIENDIYSVELKLLGAIDEDHIFLFYKLTVEASHRTILTHNNWNR